MRQASTPAYQKLGSAELYRRASELKSKLARCTLCPHHCGVNRLAGETGFCRTTDLAVLSAAQPHFGEEPELVGRGGSGTLFIGHCNLRCVFCQNHDISHEGRGTTVTAGKMARVMLQLQQMGCRNINFVTPSHVLPQIMEAVALAAADGLQTPLVYNSAGYDSVESLRWLDGVVDIYLPDFKTASAGWARRFLGVSNYPETARRALTEMYRQTGLLQTDAGGVAIRGLMIRHLVMPGNLKDTAEILSWAFRELSPSVYVNVMGQYHPAHHAWQHPELARGLSRQEHREAQALAAKLQKEARDAKNATGGNQT